MKRLSKIFAVASILTILATINANAQFYYGVKAGANISTVGTSEALKARSEYGYQAGISVGAEVPILGVGVEAEGLWVNNKMTFINEDGNKGDVISNSIEIPIMASIPVFPIIPIRVKVGPSFMLYNKAEANYTNGTKEDLDAVKSSIGYTIGLGLNIVKLTFDVRFNGQFKSSTPFNSFFGENVPSKYDVRANTFSASVGYRF
ncbi:MAG: outer membrane beta-barrel protein [Rikenellaceae bacterium]